MSSGTGTTQGLADDVKDAVGGEPVGLMARIGLTARGVVYLLLGLLAFAVAGGARSDVDQKGVLREVIERPFGGFAVGLLALGFACYAAWRISEAFTGVAGTDRRAWPRVQSAFRGLVYGVLTVTAISVLLGSRQSQGTQQSGIVAQLMQNEAGRWLVLLVGVAVVAVGAAQIYEGIKQTFMRWFPAGALEPSAYRLVRRLGTVGTIARGVVFAIAGGLVVAAAWSYEPSKAGGIDAVVTTLRGQPFGAVLLVLVALGLMAFGLFGLAEARYRRV